MFGTCYSSGQNDRTVDSDTVFFFVIRGLTLYNFLTEDGSVYFGFKNGNFWYFDTYENENVHILDNN